METCVSINCPFIAICKDYNFLIDRAGGCETQKRIVEAAELFTANNKDNKYIENEKIKRTKDILSKKNGISDSQEFGLSYGQAITYLDEIEEVITSESPIRKHDQQYIEALKMSIATGQADKILNSPKAQALLELDRTVLEEKVND